MSASLTAHSLLSLPSEVTDPGPYAVFGLRPGESDSAVIAQAMKMTIARLNAAKPHADPAAWKQAAVWVKRARGILLDPAQKAQLDQAGGSAGAAATPGAAAMPGAAAAEVPPATRAETPRRGGDSGPAVTEPASGDDPLAGLLPGLGTAGAAQQHSSAPVFRAGPARSPGSGGRHGNTSGPPVPSPAEGGRLHAGSAHPPSPPVPTSWPRSDWDPAASDHPQVPTPAAESLPNAGPLPIQIVKADAGPTARRRRRFPWASVVLTLLSVVCIAGMAGVIYMLSQNSGGIVISLQPRAAESPAGGAVAAAPPAQPAEDQQPLDPIMGQLGPKREPSTSRGPSTSRDPDRLAAADNWLANLPDSADPAMDPESSPAAVAMPTDNPQPQDPVTEPAAVTAPAAAGPEMPASAPSPLANGEVSSPASLDAAQAAMDKAHEAVKTADWATMTRLAEAAEQAAVTPEQKTKAAQLFQLAELATYYHGAIEKGLDGLGAGESFNVTEQLQIVVVEIAEEKVVFRFSGRNKDYPRRELPLVLAHRIARFALPADAPASVAAAHAYQAVAPISTPQYRQQAIDALEAMTQQVEGAEPAEIANAIRDVFGE